MFKTILWATDGSETAARALPYALAPRRDRPRPSSCVAHVREIFVGRGGGYPVLADETELRDTIAARSTSSAPTGSTRRSSSAPAPPATPQRTIAEIADEVATAA